MRLRLALSLAILAAGCGDEARAVITPEPIELGQVAPRVTAAPSRVVSRIPALLAPHLGARPRVRRAVVLEDAAGARFAFALYEWSLLDACVASYRGPDGEARRQCAQDLSIGEPVEGGNYPLRQDDVAFSRCVGLGLLKARVGGDALERTLDVRLPYLGCRLARVHAMELRELDGDAELEIVLDVETETPNWTYTTRRDGTDIATRARDAARRTLLVLGEDLGLQLAVVRREDLRLQNAYSELPDLRFGRVDFAAPRTDGHRDAMVEVVEVLADRAGCSPDRDGWLTVAPLPADADLDYCVADHSCPCNGVIEGRPWRYDAARDVWARP